MISIVTITYNRKSFLKEAIDSVQNQTYRDFEHIIIDDGSTDGTKEFMESLNNPRIRCVYSEKIGRLSVLRNMGLDMAKGEICTFLDSDDYFIDKNYLQTIKHTFDNENIFSVVGNVFVLSPEGKTALFSDNSNFQTTGNLLRQKLLNDKFVIYPSAFSFRNRHNFRFNTSLRSGANDLLVRIISEGNSVVLFEKMVCIRKHESNISSPKKFDSPYIQAYFEEFVSLDYLKKHRRIDNFLYRKSYSNYAYKVAKNLLSLNLKKEAAKHFLLAFFKYPLNYKALVRLVLLIFS